MTILPMLINLKNAVFVNYSTAMHIQCTCRATSYKTYVLIDVLYTVVSTLPVVSHVVQVLLEPYAVSQVLTFFEAFPLSWLFCSSILRCRSILLNVHKYY